MRGVDLNGIVRAIRMDIRRSRDMREYHVITIESRGYLQTNGIPGSYFFDTTYFPLRLGTFYYWIILYLPIDAFQKMLPDHLRSSGRWRHG